MISLSVQPVYATDMMLRSNAQQTGEYNEGGITPGNSILWKFLAFANGCEYFTPVVSDGTVYVQSDDRNLYALDAKTGSTKWQFPIGDSFGSPAIADGMIYDINMNGDLYAIDATTGIKKWDDNASFRDSPIVENDVLYVSNQKGNLSAIDASTGMEKWQTVVSGKVAVSNGIIYVQSWGMGDSYLYALDASTGMEKWQTDMGSFSFGTSPVVANGFVYAISSSNNLSAFDATTGALKWSVLPGGSITVSPAIADGIIYVGDCDNGVLNAFDANTGQRIWRFPMGGAEMTWGDEYQMSSPIVANGIVYIASDNTFLYAINAKKGIEIWEFDTKHLAGSDPTVADGILYYGSCDGNLYAFGGALSTSITPPTTVPTQVQETILSVPTSEMRDTYSSISTPEIQSNFSSESIIPTNQNSNIFLAIIIIGLLIGTAIVAAWKKRDYLKRRFPFLLTLIEKVEKTDWSEVKNAVSIICVIITVMIIIWAAITNSINLPTAILTAIIILFAFFNYSKK